MHNSFDIDQIVKHVKNIFDRNRCGICDKADGSRMRYPCGHTACDECVSVAEECLNCLTPPQTFANKPVQDNVLIKRVQDSTTLIESCQDTFNIDVFKRQRISEQLKVEKEVFPDCIQAPIKYCNKRKSLNTTIKNKSRRLSFPGEQVSFADTKMEKSNIVHAWLNKFEKSMSRKPLGDINVNQQMRKTAKNPINRTRLKKESVKENITNELKTKGKRSHKNSANSYDKSQSCLDRYLKSAKEFESTKRIRKELQSYNENQNDSNNDESGIVMDDGPIIIDDSQSQVFDKDKEAWLAVHEAENIFLDDSVSIDKLDDSGNVNYTNRVETTLLANNEKHHVKVPFYKKSYMVETCLLCSNDCNKNSDTAEFNDNVSITIESKTFTTTIQIYNTGQSIQKSKQKSSQVQTDICLPNKLHENNVKNNPIIINNIIKTNIEAKQFSSPESSCKENEFSKNVFADEAKITDKCCKENLNTTLERIENTPQNSHGSVNKTKCVVIDESDSDLESSGGGQIEVTAEIHRSCDLADYGVLSDVLNLGEHASRKRRAARGYTPTSTDSSDKENFNPNRVKKTKFGKKNKK